MEQKDYLLREIEKIGLVLRAILARLINNADNFSTSTGENYTAAKELMINETGVDLDKFLSLDESALIDYLSQFKGFNSDNIELLAETLFQLGINDESFNKALYLKKALQLFEFCNKTDKTYSFSRESQINKLRKLL